MCNKLKLLIFTVLVVVTTVTAVFADKADTGWMGYGLYNLNKSEVIISNESDNVVIKGSNVSAVYEYTIKNTSGKSITVNFGIPDNGITKFSVHDGSKFLSYKTRDVAYLKNNYGVTELQTPELRWYLFNMTFTSEQTRTVKVTIEAAMKKEENDTYKLNFFKDRNFSYAIKSEKADLTLKFSDFQPYNIFELEGIKQEDISEEGAASLTYVGNYGSGASLRYQPVDSMVIEKLNASEYKKPKSIAKAFNEAKYDEAITLCDEYINAPGDKNLNIEQVKYVRAEAMRRSGDNEGYLTVMGEIDTEVLYPARVGYKVAVDRLGAHDALNRSEDMAAMLKELAPDIRQGYPYLYYWLDQQGYKLAEAEEPVVVPTDKPAAGPPASGKGFDVLGAVLSFTAAVKESKWTYAVFGVLIGFVLGRFSKKNRKKGPVYLFRD